MSDYCYIIRPISSDPYDDIYIEVLLTPEMPITGVYDIYENKIENYLLNTLELTDKDHEYLSNKLYWKTFSDSIHQLEELDKLKGV